MLEGKGWANKVIWEGVVLVGGDAHYWPGEASTGHRAFVHFIKKLKPRVVIVNGDVFDGAGISRFAPIGWENFPTVQAQIEECKIRMAEISAAAKNAKKLWPLGNHDARFETSIAARAPEFAGVHGVHLKDHFPDWTPCWAVQLPGLVVKHRMKGGTHAAYNNAVRSGHSVATGHLHSLRVTPYTDYNGTRWGIDTGMLADPSGPQFAPWLEANPTDWRAGFIVLTYAGGQLMWPEVVHVVDAGVVEFRGALYEV